MILHHYKVETGNYDYDTQHSLVLCKARSTELQLTQKITNTVDQQIHTCRNLHLMTTNSELHRV